jgi:hypothetical protein
VQTKHSQKHCGNKSKCKYTEAAKTKANKTAENKIIVVKSAKSLKAAKAAKSVMEKTSQQKIGPNNVKEQKLKQESDRENESNIESDRDSEGEEEMDNSPVSSNNDSKSKHYNARKHEEGQRQKQVPTQEQER